MKKCLRAWLTILSVALNFSTADRADEIVSGKKLTTLRLYITAQKAYAQWQANPEKVKILYVATPKEDVFVSHGPQYSG